MSCTEALVQPLGSRGCYLTHPGGKRDILGILMVFPEFYSTVWQCIGSLGGSMMFHEYLEMTIILETCFQQR